MRLVAGKRQPHERVLGAGEIQVDVGVPEIPVCIVSTGNEAARTLL